MVDEMFHVDDTPEMAVVIELDENGEAKVSIHVDAKSDEPFSVDDARAFNERMHNIITIAKKIEEFITNGGLEDAATQ